MLIEGKNMIAEDKIDIKTKFEGWLCANGMNKKDMADCLECHSSTVGRWVAGKGLPSEELLARVIDFTRGYFCKEDFSCKPFKKKSLCPI